MDTNTLMRLWMRVWIGMKWYIDGFMGKFCIFVFSKLGYSKYTIKSIIVCIKCEKKHEFTEHVTYTK